MRVSSILLGAGLALFANAQTTTSNAAPSTTIDWAAQATSAQAEIARCIATCKVGDVTCTAQCVAVPSPNEEQANATHDCVAACPQGNGTEAENASYQTCITGCINTHYLTQSSGTPQPTTSAGNGNSGNGNGNGDSGNSDGDNNSNNPTGTSGNQETGTGTGPSATESTAAATMMGVSGGVAGLVGFMAAFLAL